jgi:hypothetical protein
VIDSLCDDMIGVISSFIMLLRHWSLYEAMYYSNYVASKLEVWKTQGTAKLKVNILCQVVFICTNNMKFGGFCVAILPV